MIKLSIVRVIFHFSGSWESVEKIQKFKGEGSRTVKTSTMKGFVVFFFLVAVSLPRSECKNLGLQKAKTEEEKSADVDKYYILDEKKPLADIKKFEDVSIEIDLLDTTHPKSEEQQEEEKKPEQIVIYQIGVS